MASKWISQAGAGLADGSSFANRAPQSSYSSLLSGMSAGDFMYISGETITLTAVWTNNKNSVIHIGVNPTTGALDGSIAVLDAGNTYSTCLDGGTGYYNRYINIECIRSTSWAMSIGSHSIAYNCKARNSAQGFIGSSVCYFLHCTATNNTGYGFVNSSLGSFSYCQAIGNANGFYGGISTISNCLAHANTGFGVSNCTLVDSCVLDGNGTGMTNAGGYNSHVFRTSFTNNTTALTTNATATAWVAETENYFYNNTTKFGGTTSQIWSLGDSVDGSTDPYNARASDDFTPASDAPMLNTGYKYGWKQESVNISYLNSGLNPSLPTSTPPTFAGITGADPLTTGKFKIEWTAGTGTITGYDVYCWTATNPFAQKYISVDATLTSVIVSTLGDGETFFVGGQTYYFGVRANNNGTQDGNTVEISAICTGSEFVQRVNNTYPIITLGA